MISINLNWTEPRPPTKDVCSYHHTIAETSFGRFLLTWKGWKDYADYGFDETPWGEIEYHGFGSVEEAQQWAEHELYKRVQLLLKAHPQCDESCIYLCTKAFTQAPECVNATPPPPEKDETDLAVLVQQLRGRAAFLRDGGEVKSPQLMELAADRLSQSTETARVGHGLL